VRSKVCCAEALRLLGRFDESSAFLHQTRDWAMRSDERELLLWTQLVEARLAIDVGLLSTAAEVGGDGLRGAMASGYGLLQIEFLLALAEAAHAEDDPSTARDLASRARKLATEPSCRYFWGAEAADHILSSADKGKLEPIATVRRRHHRVNLRELFPRV
jgi:hypothetical protein